MRYATSDPDKARLQDSRAAVYVDYENLFAYVHGRIGGRGRPDELISELLDQLHRYIGEELRTQTALTSAYADFSEMHGNGQYVQRSLYMRGIEPRFVPAALQRNAAEIQLCIDAIETLHNRPDVRSFVIVTGDRLYLPLVQHFKRYGCQAVIATLSPPPSTDALPHAEDDVFLDALNLLSEGARRALTGSSGRDAGSPPQGRPEPVEHKAITSEGARLGLEIIEEHFGQYEEVYLTPLLRKMSELLDENRYDPKTLISELEDAGAVWLEKRRGFPYDYTVLLVDTDHPDVQAVQEEVYGRRADGDFDDEEFGDDDFADDEYDEDYDDYPEDEADDFDADDEAGDFDPDDEDYTDDYPDDEADTYTNGTPSADDDFEDFVDADEEDEEVR